MKISELKALVKNGESEKLEFKTSTGNISAGMQTICAFLNSKYGGVLIFGVKDNGQIIGQAVTDKTHKDIALELNKIEPYVKIDIEYIKVADNSQVIVLLVHPSDKAPYTYDGRPFIRNQSTTMKMPKDEYISLYNQNNPTLWESLTNNTCTIKDLDAKRIKEIIHSAVFEKRLASSALKDNTTTILKKLGLMVDKKLTNAAVILFCKDEYKEFIQSSIKLARFKGTSKTEFLDTKMFRANAFDLYDKASDFLHFVLPVAAWIEPGKSERVEEPAIPYNVLREALVNALVHRDYSHSGGVINIAVYDDRLTISNPGFLPTSLNLKQLTQEHQSIARNPIIANVFYICGKIERWGRGTLDMINNSKLVGNPLPKFEESGGGFSITLRFKQSINTIVHVEPKQAKTENLTIRQKAIINALQNGPLNRIQIMNKIKIQLTDRVMQLELNKLKKLSLIDSKGSAQSTVWFLLN